MPECTGQRPPPPHPRRTCLFGTTIKIGPDSPFCTFYKRRGKRRFDTFNRTLANKYSHSYKIIRSSCPFRLLSSPCLPSGNVNREGKSYFFIYLFLRDFLYRSLKLKCLPGWIPSCFFHETSCMTVFQRLVEEVIRPVHRLALSHLRLRAYHILYMTGPNLALPSSDPQEPNKIP